MHSRWGSSSWHQHGNSLISLLLKDHFAAAVLAAVASAADVAGAQKIVWVVGVETDRMRWRG